MELDSGLDFREPPAKRQQLDFAAGQGFYSSQYLPPTASLDQASQYYDFDENGYQQLSGDFWTNLLQHNWGHEAEILGSATSGLGRNPTLNHASRLGSNQLPQVSNYYDQSYGLSEVQQSTPIAFDQFRDETLPPTEDQTCFGMVRLYSSIDLKT